MTTSEAGLLDTNILVYAADETSPLHKATMLPIFIPTTKMTSPNLGK